MMQQIIPFIWFDGRAEEAVNFYCGWVKDRFGVVWNIVPRGLGEYLGGDDAAGANRAMQAMLAMDKLDLDALRRAYENAHT
jgi:predicted 3-demethylubiquinone-9 3-methyltransferase (glyoxalase superfamily)